MYSNRCLEKQVEKTVGPSSSARPLHSAAIKEKLGRVLPSENPADHLLAGAATTPLWSSTTWLRYTEMPVPRFRRDGLNSPRIAEALQIVDSVLKRKSKQQNLAQ